MLSAVIDLVTEVVHNYPKEVKNFMVNIGNFVKQHPISSVFIILFICMFVMMVFVVKYLLKIIKEKNIKINTLQKKIEEMESSIAKGYVQNGGNHFDGLHFNQCNQGIVFESKEKED